MDTLLNFSGGIDSTYCLWRYLVENPKKKLLVHHCHMKTSFNRHDQESQAVADILKWMDDHGLTNYKYIETTVDIRQLGVKPVDHQIINFITGTICLNAKYYGIKYLLLPTIRDEVERLGKRYLTAIWEDSQLFRSSPRLTMGTDKRAKLQPVTPIIERYKQDFIKEMPKDLFDLTFFCRIPKGRKACGKCHTCKQAGIEEEIL